MHEFLNYNIICTPIYNLQLSIKASFTKKKYPFTPDTNCKIIFLIENGFLFFDGFLKINGGHNQLPITFFRFSVQ